MARDTPGRIYTIHLERPLGDPNGNGGKNSASHYTGWTSGNVHRRLAEHRGRRVGDGNERRGGAMLAFANTAGVAWHVVEIRDGTPDDERRLKQHSARTRCPICTPRKDTRPMYPDTKTYTTAGNVGVTARQVYTFHCGICPTRAEYVGANISEAKAKAQGDGWRNGYRRDLASIYQDGVFIPSSWRCPECIPRSPRREDI